MVPRRAASLQQHQKQLFEADNQALRLQNAALVQQNAHIRNRNASLEAELSRLCTRTVRLAFPSYEIAPAVLPKQEANIVR